MSEVIETLGIMLSRCVCVSRISFGGEGNALYPVLSSCCCCCCCCRRCCVLLTVVKYVFFSEIIVAGTEPDVPDVADEEEEEEDEEKEWQEAEQKDDTDDEVELTPFCCLLYLFAVGDI